MNKANHPAFKKFFRKHTHHEPYGRCQLTKQAHDLLPSAIKSIQKAIDEDKIYITFDGASTTNHKFNGLMVGSMSHAEIGPYSLEIEKDRHGTAQSAFDFVQHGLDSLYPEGKWLFYSCF